MLFCNYFVNFIAYDLKNKYPIYIENIGYFRYFRKYRYIYQLCTELTSVITSVSRQTNMCDDRACASLVALAIDIIVLVLTASTCVRAVFCTRFLVSFLNFRCLNVTTLFNINGKNMFSFRRDCQLLCCHSAPFSSQNTCSGYFSLYFLM